MPPSPPSNFIPSLAGHSGRSEGSAKFDRTLPHRRSRSRKIQFLIRVFGDDVGVSQIRRSHQIDGGRPIRQFAVLPCDFTPLQHDDRRQQQRPNPEHRSAEQA